MEDKQNNKSIRQIYWGQRRQGGLTAALVQYLAKTFGNRLVKTKEMEIDAPIFPCSSRAGSTPIPSHSFPAVANELELSDITANTQMGVLVFTQDGVWGRNSQDMNSRNDQEGTSGQSKEAAVSARLYQDVDKESFDSGER